MILETGPDYENQKEISEHYTINHAESSDIKVYEKGIAGKHESACL